MVINKGVIDFLNEVESSNPTPGGGSVVALVASLGSCLARMYQSLSFDRKCYTNLSEDKQDEFMSIYSELAIIRENLLVAAQKDIDSYQEVIKAYRLPKETEVEKASREKEIITKTIEAIEPPLMVMRNSLTGLKLIEKIITSGNRNVVSDAGVAAILLKAAIDGSSLNVDVNCAKLSDDIKKEFISESNTICLEAENLTKIIINSTRSQILS